MRTLRVLIRVELVYHTRTLLKMAFHIPCWDGAKHLFECTVPDNLSGKVKDGDRVYARTQLGEEDPTKMTFNEWEYPKQMTDEELDTFMDELLKKSKDK